VIEERNGTLIPVEYKHGKEGRWLNDAVQLCAQALCIEELLASETLKNQEACPAEPSAIPYGYIYYAGSHRRTQVNFTEELRTQTLDIIAQALAIAGQEQIPPPLERPLACRCIHCSLQPLCLPEEVKLLQSKGA
jgi:CRISPR-associated exonuclease Cas4